MTTFLPPEILEIILSYLQHDNDASSLRACALVSSVFLPIARGFLFGHIFLLPQPRQPATVLPSRSYSLASRTHNQPEDVQSGPRSESLSPYVFSSRSAPSVERHVEPETHDASACIKLNRLLSMTPSLASHIKRLSIIDGRLFPSTDFSLSQNDALFNTLGLGNAQSQQYYTLRDSLNGPQWFLSTPSRALYMLFEKLKLQSFDLVFQDGPKVAWHLIPRDIRSALNFLFTCPSLQALQLRGISWDTPASLHDLTTTLAQGSITDLTLRNVKLLSTSPSAPRIPRRGRPPTRRDTSPHPYASLDCNEKKPIAKQNQPTRHSTHAKPFPEDLNLGSRTQNQNQDYLIAPASASPSYTTHPSHALRLESLHIGSTFNPTTVPSASDTLDLLRALFTPSYLYPSNPIASSDDHEAGQAAPPLVNPHHIKRLSIPAMDLDNLSELCGILTRSGVTSGLEMLELNDRLSFSTSGGYLIPCLPTSRDTLLSLAPKPPCVSPLLTLPTPPLF